MILDKLQDTSNTVFLMKLTAFLIAHDFSPCSDTRPYETTTPCYTFNFTALTLTQRTTNILTANNLILDQSRIYVVEL